MQNSPSHDDALATAAAPGSPGAAGVRRRVARTRKADDGEGSFFSDDIGQRPTTSGNVIRFDEAVGMVGTADAASPLEQAQGFTKADMLAWHLRVLTTPAGELDQNHPLCQEYSCEVSANGAVTKLKAKMVSKMDSAKQISALCGWLSADEGAAKPADGLATLIGEMRGR